MAEMTSIEKERQASNRKVSLLESQAKEAESIRAELTQKDKRQEELQKEIPSKTVQPQPDTPYKLEQEDWTQLIVTKLTQWFQSVGILRQASIEH